MSPAHTEPHPLTAAEVEASRQRYGENRLTKRPRIGFWRQFLGNFGDPIIKVLLAALAINLLFLFRHFDWYESAGIAVAIFLATFVSTLSEHGSEAAFARLQEDADRIFCRVRRAGQVAECPIGDIVVGDLVLLQSGERVPADGRLIEGVIRADQSALNGESGEAEKWAGTAGEDDDLLSPARLFRGSVVCSGEGVLYVERIGDATFYGRLAQEIQEGTRESPLKLRLAGLAKTISRLGYLAAVLIAVADLLCSLLMQCHFRPSEMLTALSVPVLLEHVMHAVTLAITVVVVAVPEGLPMMITVVLSSNMRRMLKDHVLVRKLVGIETSGSLNLLFTDKTGTLTKGRPEVTHFVDGAGRVYSRAALLRQQRPLWHAVVQSCRCNSESLFSAGHILGGNATDRALLQYVLPLPDEPEPRRLYHLPFDSSRKYSAARPEGDRVYIKGAPEILLPHCTQFMDTDGRIRPLQAARLIEEWQKLTGRAMRVLLLAVSDEPMCDDRLPATLILLGLVGIRDDIRPEAARAVAQIRGAGIQMVMMTGDNRETASVIADEIGLLEDGGRHGEVMTGEDLSVLSDEEVTALLPRLRVVARALPTDKSRLVRLAQAQGLVTGMTGDGINDAPALKKADVGFAMGSGTEVAKEAGDIVILDDNIASIAKAVLYGRTIFKNIRKFIVFQLTMNLCAVGVSLIGPFIGIDTPVPVMQMLWINIIMDTLAGLAFAGEPPLPEYMEETPKQRTEPVLNRAMLGQILGMGLYTVALCIAFLKLPVLNCRFRTDTYNVYRMTAFFALFIFTGIFNSFNARTPRLNLLTHLRKNRLFTAIMLLVAAVQLILIYCGGTLFRTAGLTPRELWWVLLLSFTVIPADLLRKVLRKRRGRPLDL